MEESIDELIMVTEQDIPLCKYNIYCPTKSAEGYHFCLASKAQNCQTARFYKKYGHDYLNIKTRGDTNETKHQHR